MKTTDGEKIRKGKKYFIIDWFYLKIIYTQCTYQNGIECLFKSKHRWFYHQTKGSVYSDKTKAERRLKRVVKEKIRTLKDEIQKAETEINELFQKINKN